MFQTNIFGQFVSSYNWFFFKFWRVNMHGFTPPSTLQSKSCTYVNLEVCENLLLFNLQHVAKLTKMAAHSNVVWPQVLRYLVSPLRSETALYANLWLWVCVASTWIKSCVDTMGYRLYVLPQPWQVGHPILSNQISM